MTRTSPKITDLFDRIFVSLAICSPILMVIVAGMMPVGSRGPECNEHSSLRPSA